MPTKLCQDIPSINMHRNQQEISWNQLNRFRKEKQLFDITICCSDGEVPAHKIVLATVSEYFKVLFTSPISVGLSSSIVDLHDFSVEAVTLLLDVIYDMSKLYLIWLL